MTDPRTTDAYRRLDEQAGNYADADRAVAAAERRRHRTMAAAPTAALVVTAVAIGVVTVLHPGRGDAPMRPPPARPGTLFTAPASTHRPLPATALGRAVLVYSPCLDRCEVVVSLADGREFAVPPNPEGGGAAGTTLSPDGRWLGYPVSGDFLLRDLTGTVVRRVVHSAVGARVGPWTWSGDSSRLLLAERRGGQEVGYPLLTPATGALVAAPTNASAKPIGVLPSGALLTRAQTSSGPTATLSWTGGSPFTVRGGDQLRKGESLGGAYLARDGRSLYVIAGSTHPDVAGVIDEPIAVLQADLTGRVLRRIDLGRKAGEFWYPIGVDADGMVFGRRGKHQGTDATVLVTLTASGPRDGRVLPSEAVIRTPGAAVN